MRIVLAQFGAGRDKAENLRRMLELTAQAAERGGELVLFPECAMVSLPAGQSLAADAEPLDGPFNQALAAAAAQSRIAVVAGLYESIAASDKVFNTVVAFGPDGDRLGLSRSRSGHQIPNTGAAGAVRMPTSTTRPANATVAGTEKARATMTREGRLTAGSVIRRAAAGAIGNPARSRP